MYGYRPEISVCVSIFTIQSGPVPKRTDYLWVFGIRNMKTKIQESKEYSIHRRNSTYSGSKSIMWARGYRWLIRIAVGLGIAALFYYFGWWFTDQRLASPW